MHQFGVCVALGLAWGTLRAGMGPTKYSTVIPDQISSCNVGQLGLHDIPMALTFVYDDCTTK